MTSPLVTVLMGVHNGERFLSASIESVLHQTLTDLEIVIVDDGSTDATPRLLEDFSKKDPRLRLARQDRQTGLAAALNKGLKLARGEFIARQDADDVSMPERLAIQASFLRSHPEAGVVGTSHYLMNEEGEYLDLIRLNRTDTEIRWRMLFHNCMNHPTVMFRANLRTPGQPLYNESIRYCDDYELWLRLLQRTRFADLDVPLLAYRIHGGQLTEFHGRGPGRNREELSVAHAEWNRLLPSASLTLDDLEILQQWSFRPPRRLRKGQRRLADALVNVFDIFLRENPVELEAAIRIRNRWIEPMVDLLCRKPARRASTMAEMPDPWSGTLHPRRLAQWGRVRAARVKQRLLSVGGHADPIPPTTDYADENSIRHSRRALVVYVARAFRLGPAEIARPPHSNLPQCIEIAKAFNRLGFIVDIVDWMDFDWEPTHPYEVFFGMHHNFERLSPKLPEKCLKIYYATGEYWADEKKSIEQRHEELRERRGIDFEPRIPLGENRWAESADAVVVIGNERTSEGYRRVNPNVHLIDNSVLANGPVDLRSKNFTSARNHFLILCGMGLLRRGLDLALEAFAVEKDLHLWVCGVLQADHDQGFVRAYRRELFHTPNIHPLGWVDIYSAAFSRLTAECAFSIYPTCTEGISGSVLNAMGRGLIPIVSSKAGISVDRFGWDLGDCSVSNIRSQIRQAAEASADDLRERAQAAHKTAHTRYSLPGFRENIERILRAVITEHAQRKS